MEDSQQVAENIKQAVRQPERSYCSENLIRDSLEAAKRAKSDNENGCCRLNEMRETQNIFFIIHTFSCIFTLYIKM